MKRLVAVPATTAALVVLAGCGSGGSGSGLVQPAPQAAASACTGLAGRLPNQVLGRPRNTLAVAGAASWGDPAIVLRCGVTPPGPTTDHCIGADGLDWVFSETRTTFRFVTFGRAPGVEVTVPASVGRTVAPDALIDLASAVRPVPTTTTACS